MLAIFKYEWKNSVKNYIIWTLLVGGLGLVCLLLYRSMEESMAGMADSFSSMGAFSDAFGMSTLSIATVAGYFATEIGTIHGLGCGMYAASIATTILSKEEDAHTAEFTYSLPISRGKVLAAKLLYIITNLAAFHAVCGILYECGFLILKENSVGKEFLSFMALQLLMSIEIAFVCFLISACSKKNRLGTGIGLALIFYLVDLMGRVIPELKKIIFLFPYSYANASEIFSKSWDCGKGLLVGIGAMIIMIISSYLIYNKRDLAS